MASLIEQITHDIADAMKQKNQATLAPLRMLKAAIMNKEVEKGRSLDDAESVQVVNSLVKQRRDSIEQFKAGGRQDLVDREHAEVVFLQRYLPPARELTKLFRPQLRLTLVKGTQRASHPSSGQGPQSQGLRPLLFFGTLSVRPRRSPAAAVPDLSPLTTFFARLISPG